MYMPPSSPLTCQSFVMPVTDVRARLRTLFSLAPTCMKPPSGSHTPTYLTISPRREFGMSGWANSVSLSRSTTNSCAWPLSVRKLRAPTSSRRALWVRLPSASATQISSTPRSFAKTRRRRLDSSGSFHHGSLRIS